MLTELLQRWRAGDRSVEAQLMELAYPALREIAHAHARRNPGALTLQPTELAHEAYERLAEQSEVEWKSRQHFFAIAATITRRVMIDYLRMRSSEKRGGGLPFVSLASLSEAELPVIDESLDWIGLDKAVDELVLEDADLGRLVELKFFSGLNAEEIAEVMGSSVATVGRQWRFARAWLGRRLGVDTQAAPGE